MTGKASLRSGAVANKPRNRTQCRRVRTCTACGKNRLAVPMTNTAKARSTETQHWGSELAAVIETDHRAKPAVADELKMFDDSRFENRVWT